MQIYNFFLTYANNFALFMQKVVHYKGKLASLKKTGKKTIHSNRENVVN